AWLTALGPGTGALGLDVADGLVVARLQGGRSVSIDVETGSPCAVLVEAPRLNPTPGIHPFTTHSVAPHAARVRPSRFSTIAVALWSGATRWDHDLAHLLDMENVLRESLRVVPARTALIAEFPVPHQEQGSLFRVEEMVAALDPATGRELWRK